MTLMLLLVLANPSVPFPVLIQDATGLGAEELVRLDGQTVRVRGTASVPFWGMVSIDGPKEGDWAAEWEGEAEVAVLLECRLSVIRHLPGVRIGEWFPGFTEFRLRKARVVR